MILDTNAVSDFADANQGLLNRLQQSAEDIHLPVIVLGEYPGVKSSRLRTVARVGLMSSNPLPLYSPLLQKPVAFMLTSVMSSVSLASPYRRTTSGLPLWQGSTCCRFSATMRTSIKCPDLNESVGDGPIASILFPRFRNCESMGVPVRVLSIPNGLNEAQRLNGNIRSW